MSQAFFVWILRTTRQTGPFGPRLDTRLISKKLYHFPALDCTKLIVDFILKITVQCIIIIIFFFFLFSQVRRQLRPRRPRSKRCNTSSARDVVPWRVTRPIPRDSWRILQFVFASKDLKVISLRRLAARVADETHCHSSSATIQCLSGYCEHPHMPILSRVAS
jgi:hypothetical protein